MAGLFSDGDDGVRVSFSGEAYDTVARTLCNLEGLRIRLTTEVGRPWSGVCGRTGDALVVKACENTSEEPWQYLVVRGYMDDDDDMPDVAEYRVPWDDVEAIHVY